MHEELKEQLQSDMEALWGFHNISEMHEFIRKILDQAEALDREDQEEIKNDLRSMVLDWASDFRL